MSRLRRMAHNVASSYAALFAASIYGLASIPVALHYLGADSGRFGLWMLMSTITGYLSLVDLGMSASVARLLVDHKDRRAGGEYGGLIKTGALVSQIQAAIILLAGIGLAPLLALLLKIDPPLRREFIHLLGWQCGSVAVAFALRIFSHILSAQQRNDIQNYAQVTGFILNFAAMWLFFQWGQGVLSLAWATLLTNVYIGSVCAVGCLRLNFLPPGGAWGRVSWPRFREVFSYGQAMFLVSLGTLMITSSQILVIQRSLGSTAATIWGVGIRLFSLVSQLIWRVSDTAAPAFSEMMVRGERQKLLTRFREVVMVTGSLSAFCAVGFVLCNRDFVTLLSHGDISWTRGNDLALGAWMILMAVLRCHTGFVLLTKNIGFMRYVYFVEGVVLVTSASLISRSGGIPGIVGCSLVCSCVFSGAYGVWRTVHYFSVSYREVVVHWLKFMAKTVLLCTPVAGILWLAELVVLLPTVRLAIYAIVYGGAGVFILLRYGLPADFQRDVISRAPKVVLPLLRRVLIIH